MKESPSILKNDEAADSFDLFELKDKGLNKIQLLSGNNWTDYNSHDPGVTILETLCYALTDLAYRSHFDIATILNTTGRKKIKNSLFPAHEILTTSPLSFFDFKRLILDIDGIKNGEFIPAYSEKVIPGIFDIEIELHPDFDNDISRDNIKKKIHLFIKSVCPLGVVFEKITFLEYDLIGIILEVEMSEDVDPKKICAQFIQHAQNYFSSEIKFNSLNDLLEKNIGVETIFDGPLLKNGFLLNEQLLNQTVRKRIFVSDLFSRDRGGNICGLSGRGGVGICHRRQHRAKNNEATRIGRILAGDGQKDLDHRMPAGCRSGRHRVSYPILEAWRRNSFSGPALVSCGSAGRSQCNCQRLSHFNSIYPRRQNAPGVTGAFACGVQAA